MEVKETKDYYRVVTDCYLSDKKILDTYHIIAPTTLQEAVNHTVNVFENSQDFTMYELIDDDFMGYFGIQITDIVVVKGFFIMPQYRKSFGSMLLPLISEMFGDNVYIAVYTKNERACLFLLKNNCSFVCEQTDETNGFMYVVFKLKSLCQ